MKKLLLTPILVLSVLLMFSRGAALAASPVGFNFEDPADNYPYPAPNGYRINEDLDPSEIAGAVPQTNWNNLWQGGTGVPPGVLVEDGIRITWATQGGTHALTSYVPPPADFKLMRGYLDLGDNTNTVPPRFTTNVVLVTGVPFRLYDVLCYSIGDNGSATRVAQFALTSTNNGVLFTNITKFVQDDANYVFDGYTYIEANSTNGWPNAASGNYCRFYNIRGTNFTIVNTANYGSDGNPRGPFNALQIVPIETAPVLSNPSYTNGQFQCFLDGTPGSSYIILASTNLTEWIPISTNIAPAQITDIPPPNTPERFYRAQLQ